MKTIATILSMIFLMILSSVSANAQVYRSKNFEKEGVNEYIEIFWGTSANYSTSEDEKPISLTINGALSKINVNYVVSFPDQSISYNLIIKEDKLLCEHPDGRKQWFEKLPTTYRSADFETPGTIEYIEQASDRNYIYFTNLNESQRIKLERISNPSEYTIRVKFPNDQKVYKFYFEPACLGDLICTHPDGRQQEFNYYHWDKELR